MHMMDKKKKCKVVKSGKGYAIRCKGKYGKQVTVGGFGTKGEANMALAHTRKKVKKMKKMHMSNAYMY